jgi:DNA-binding NtrC family response regulator
MRILIAEDEPDIARTYKIALEDRNHEVIIAEDGNECTKIYNEEFFRQTTNNRTRPMSSLAPTPLSSRESKAREGDYKNYNNDNDYSNSSSYPSSSSSSSPSVASSSSLSPFDAVILDYRMPGKDGMEVAKEILELNAKQRIIFASAYVQETLEDAVKQLKQVVELMQKPFDAQVLVDAIEDKEVHDGIQKLMTNLKQTKDLEEATLEQMRDLFEGLRKIQKGRTF